jgi:hypothetical protein
VLLFSRSHPIPSHPSIHPITASPLPNPHPPNHTPGVDYGSRNVLADPAIREGIKAYTGWPTIPQVFARGPDGASAFLGGADILMAMHNAGELEAALSGKEAGGSGDGHVHGPGCNH